MRPIQFKDLCWSDLEELAESQGLYPHEQQTRYLTYLEEDNLPYPGAGLISIQQYISPRWGRTAYIVCYQSHSSGKLLRLQFDTARMDIAIQQAHMVLKQLLENERRKENT